ncbi:MAG: glycosyltransferase family 1 protein [Cyanobacteria bacterium J083]|nr:MAG: glycosyltransferase family 1 protein [Cyanobacteria bacterium J083]
MRILSIHNRYQIRGGEDESCLAEQNLLRENGHQVDVYEENNERVTKLNPLNLAMKTVWSTEAYQTVTRLLKQQSYNLVHVQNFFPLISPSVYYAANKAGVPVVQTIRNYRLLCPNALFFKDGEVCQQCINKFIPYPGVLRGCYRENQIASAGVATMLTVHRGLKTWTEKVDLYICLTEFAREKMIAGGLPAAKIVVKPNFVSPDPGLGNQSGGYAIYVGRLSVEKGLDTLLAAWQLLDRRIPLKIVGDGTLADQVLAITKQHPEIEWLGRKPMKQVYDLIGEARFLIFPSKWYETFGRVAVEAFAKGTPVIASQIGAIAEIVDSYRTGLQFQPGNARDLATKVDWALTHPKELARMSRAARAEFTAKYTARENYRRLRGIYSLVL